VVGVEGMPQTEGVCQDADADAVDARGAEVVTTRDDERKQDSEADQVKENDECVHAPDGGPIALVEAGTEASESGIGDRRARDVHELPLRRVTLRNTCFRPFA
jgi:hypothetical protein